MVERLAGLEDAKIAERNRRLDRVNDDLSRWRGLVKGEGAPTLKGELTIQEPDGRVTFQGDVALVDLKPRFDPRRLPPDMEIIEVELK